MSDSEKVYRQRARKAKLAMWIARRGSRNTGPIDRLCRRLLARATQLEPEQDFMRDEWVESNEGFDPDELARYQRGESRDPGAAGS